jgi:hypothetical protein
MLRISVFSSPSGTSLRLKGVLCAASADQLESCWQILRATGGDRPICVNLDDVWRVSRAGKELLDQMRTDGVIVVDNALRRAPAWGGDRPAHG